VLYSRAGRPRLLHLIEQHHNLLARYLLPSWAQYGVMKHWAGGEEELIQLVEQHQVPEAVEWLQRDLAIARERVVRTSNQ
jgi:DNA-binding GntR family transcriptional regulator